MRRCCCSGCSLPTTRQPSSTSSYGAARNRPSEMRRASMRIELAIEAFLDWRQLERDATPRSLDSYRRILWKLAEDYPETPLDAVTTADLRAFLHRWRSAS